MLLLKEQGKQPRGNSFTMDELDDDDDDEEGASFFRTNEVAFIKTLSGLSNLTFRQFCCLSLGSVW